MSAITNNYSQLLRDAICCGNVAEVSQVLDKASDELSQPYCTVLIEVLRGGSCSIIPIIIRYLAPCDALLLSERYCYQGDSPFARQLINQAYDVFAFSVKVVLSMMDNDRNASYEGTNQQEICQLLSKRGAPIFQGLLHFNQCNIMTLQATQQRQVLILHKEMLQTLGLQHEKAMRIGYKEELAYEYYQYVQQTADPIGALITFSHRLSTVLDSQNRYVHLELIHEIVVSLQGQKIAECLFLSNDSNSDCLQKIKDSISNYKKKFLAHYASNIEKKQTILCLKIDKRLSSLLNIKNMLVQFGLSSTCRIITNPLTTRNEEIRRISAEYMLKMLEIMTKEHLDFQMKTRGTLISQMVKELQALITIMPSFIPLLPHIENIVGQIIEKITVLHKELLFFKKA